MSEANRLKIVSSYGVLDKALGPAFDRLTRLASDIFDVPVARFTFDAADPFCAHAVRLAGGTVLMVEDAASDNRFKASPLVAGEPFVRFCAAAVLTDRQGVNLGALCILDDRVRPPLTTAEIERLKALAWMATDTLELRRMARRDAETERGVELVERLAVAGRKAQAAWPAQVRRLRRAV